MNRIISASLCAVVLLAAACRRDCHINLVKPAGIKPIDRAAYNDVYTVFWNTLADDCHSAGYPTGDTIMIYGKLDTVTYYRHKFFALTCEQEYEPNSIYDFVRKYDHFRGPSVNISFFVPLDEIQEKLDTCDLTQRCYIKGEFAPGRVGGKGGITGPDDCCFTVPGMDLKNMNDIYFENEKNDE